MASRPVVIAFDVIETLFSLESLRERLQSQRLPDHILETWFAHILRDGFALDATGVYEPFAKVATAALEALARSVQPSADVAAEEIMKGFSELEAHPDVAPAMSALRDADIRMVTLTNGSASVTQRLLERAGLQGFVERIISVDEVRRWKPRREVYIHCADTTGVEPHRLALIAAHAWDIHGARHAGLITGYVSRHNSVFPSTMDKPNVEGATLVEVAARLAE